MLTRDGVIARYIFAFCFFFLSGSGIVTGWLGGLCGILGTMELVTALQRYSPLYDMYDLVTQKSKDKTRTNIDTITTTFKDKKTA